MKLLPLIPIVIICSCLISESPTIVTGDKSQGIGFLMKNEVSSYELQSFTVTIDSVESLVKFDFFVGVEDSVEGEVDLGEWRWCSGRNQNRITALTTNVKSEQSSGYSINKNSGIRHNSTCRYFNCKNCSSCGKEKGRACKLYGG